MARKIAVEIVGDASSYEKSLRRAARDTSRFNREVGKSFRGVAAGSGAFKLLGRQVAFASGAFLGAAGFTAVAKQSVEIASNLAEQQNKVNVVFGQSGRSIVNWAKTTATSMGIANDQALEAVGTFGNLFRTVGLVPEKNADLSRSLVKLAADMASFNNADPSEVLLALRSGLIGEAEPLRRFGVLLSETRVQQEAMRETGKTTTKALTDQEKVLARYTLVMKDTASAQGDFARTSDGLANASRQLHAEIRDTEAVIGQALLPTVQDVTLALRDWLAKPQNQKRIQEDTKKTVGFFGALFHETKNVAGGFKTIYDGFNAVHKASTGANDAIENFLRSLVRVQKQAKTGEDVRLRAGGAFLPVTGEDVAQRGAAARTGGRIPTGAAAKLGRPRASLNFQISLLLEQLAKAEITAAKRDERAVLVRLAALTREKITKTKDLAERTRLYQTLGSYTDQIRSIDEKAATDRRTARQKELDAAKKAAQAAKEHAAKLKALEKHRQQLEKQRQQQALTRLTAAQFRQLGFGPSGADVIPGGKELIKRLGKIKDQVKGTVLDTKENRKLLERIRHTLVDGLGKLAPEVRSKIDELLDALDIEDAAKKRGKKFDFGRRDFGHGFGGLPEFMRTGLTRLGTPAGMPIPRLLTAAQLPARLQVNTMNVHLHGVQDVAQLENELVKRTKSRPHPRRGP